MQNDSQLTTKKIVAIIVTVVAVFALLQWFIGYLTFGKLVIVTDSKYDNIAVSSQKQSNTPQNSPIKKSKGSFSARLKAGTYFVSVENGVNGTTRLVKVKGHSTIHLDIKLLKTTGVEPVLYNSAQNIVADAQHLRYLDPADNSVNQLDTRNQISTISINYSLLSIAWADADYGVGQNAAGQLFVIDHETIRPLDSPISGKDDTGVVFSVAPNHKIYIGRGSNIYAGTEKKGFEKIYQDMVANSFLVGGAHDVALIANGYSGSPSVTLINDKGKTRTKKFNAPVNGWSKWSANDKYITFIEGSEGIVYDSSFRQVAVIPQGNIKYGVWRSDDTLFYSAGSQLWSYKPNQQASQLIANMPQDSSVKELAVSQDGTYVYLVSQSDNSDNQSQAIKRVGLRGQSVSQYIYNLQSIMPLNEGGQTISLINFNSPATIWVQNYPGNASGNSVQHAQAILQQRGFNPGAFRYHLSNIVP